MGLIKKGIMWPFLGQRFELTHQVLLEISVMMAKNLMITMCLVTHLLYDNDGDFGGEDLLINQCEGGGSKFYRENIFKFIIFFF